VACQQGIDPQIKDSLIHLGLIPLERLSLRYMQSFQELTGALPFSSLSDIIREEDLGRIGSLALTQVSGKEVLHLQPPNGSCAKLQTLLLAHRDQAGLEELEKSVCQAFSVLFSQYGKGVNSEEPSAVPGAGCAELHMGHYLVFRAQQVAKRQRAAVVSTSQHTPSKVLRLVEGLGEIVLSSIRHLDCKPTSVSQDVVGLLHKANEESAKEMEVRVQTFLAAEERSGAGGFEFWGWDPKLQRAKNVWSQSDQVGVSAVLDPLGSKLSALQSAFAAAAVLLQIEGAVWSIGS